VLSNLSLSGFTQPITTRGYTAHEMVDDMGIIHMTKISGIFLNAAGGP
jgi:copper(I)-binding protein